MFLTLLEVSQFNTSFTFTSSILIFFSSITASKNSTFLIFYLHFSGFTYRSFSASLFTTSSTTLSCPSSSSVSTIISSRKLVTFPMLIKFHRISFIIVWSIVGELVSQKNITIDLNGFSRVVNTTFYLFPSFIHDHIPTMNLI